ncbi:T9SS type A sorting domain-containing protein [Chitinophaga sp. Mgbs1]|uniref:chitinase n=1 Tax=Chitinophaga solisilvae TaxID=1233460 RepID=A0A3S1B422_9BACT|nr:T9SS type A sorting domain-containing protein [Chitinophaga solisilvae]
MTPKSTFGGMVLRCIAATCCLLTLLGGSSNAQVSPNVPATTRSHNKQVIGYITQWDAWKNVAGITPLGGYNHLNVDYSQYTILNFSFFGVAKDGSLHSGDFRNKNIWSVGAVQEPAALLNEDIYSSWDLYLLYGELEVLYYISDNSYAYTLGYRNSGSGWNNVNTGRSGSFPLSVPKQGGAPGLIDLAHQKGVKVLASIGGWSMCKHYPEVAADATKRAKFVAGCQQLISMGFDGIDFDWEYPNDPGMNIERYSTADYTNFAILIEQVRAAIGPNKLMTSCFSAAGRKLPGFDWPRVNNTLDYFNMMTYDYNGGWSGIAGHNSPLYDYPGQEVAGFSLDATTKAVRALGVNMNKVNLGAAFYGRGVITTGAAALNGPTTKRPETVQPDGPIQTCADYTNWTKDVWDGTPNYSYIQQQTGSGSGWTEHWDDNAKVPYKTKGNFFLSYDNERSVAAKAQYIKDNSLAGVIIWQVYGDMTNMTTSTVPKGKLIFCPNTIHPLVNKINETFAAGGTGNNPPTISISAPANNAVYTAPATINIQANAADPDGRVVRVEFYNGATKLGVDSTSPYTYAWNNVPAGTYSLKAVATDDKGAATNSSLVSVTVNTGGGGIDTSGKVIVGYWQNWGSPSDPSPYIPLRDVNPKYNVIEIAFPTSGTDQATISFVPENQTSAQFLADVQYLQGQGKKVLLSIGGQNGSLNLTTAAQKQAFVTSMKAILDQYNFDGFDLDIEGGTSLQLDNGDKDFTNPTTPKVVNLIAACKEILAYRKGQGKNGWLTMAPETYYVQTAYGSNYSPLVGAYLPIIYGLRNELTFIQTQYYNTGSVMALDNGVYNQGTSDFIVGMSEMLLKGFPVSGTSQTFPALRPDQVAFGIPATTSAAGGGYISPANVKKALDYLIKGQSYGGAYQLRNPAGYPGFRGIMTWSVNWDKANNNEFANNYYEYFFGGTPGNKPPRVSISTPANNTVYNTAPANINITAAASDSDGVVVRVAFYNGGTLLAVDSVAPYSYAWNNVPAGNYAITARATDNGGATTTSATVNVTVNGVVNNKPPQVSITAPANNTVYNTAPATVNITAAASDSDGVVVRVAFYNGSTLLGTDSTAPYTYTWSNVAAGSYSITARATDNSNATTTSGVISITVNGGGGGNCAGVPAYQPYPKIYSKGERVVENNNLYECKADGIYNVSPTSAWWWWTLVGPCSGGTTTARSAGAPVNAVNDAPLTAAQGSAPVIVYPNPVSGTDVQIKVEAAHNDKLLVEVLDLKGSAPLLRQIHASSHKGTQPIRIDMTRIPQGTWIIRVTNQQTGKVSSAKVIRL